MTDKNTKKITIIIVVIIALVLVVATAIILTKNNSNANNSSPTATTGGTNTTNTTSTHAPITITVAGYSGSGGLVSNEPFLLAQHLGYLPSYITIKESDVALGAAEIAAMAKGDVTVSHIQYNNLLRAVAGGAKVTAVLSAHGGQSTTNWHVFVKNDSPIKSAADLKGKKIGEVIPGDTSEIALKEYLATANLTIKDVTLVSIPFGQEKQVLDAGQVDAEGVWSDFTIGQLEADPTHYRTLFTIYDTLPAGMLHCGVIFEDDFIAKNPDVVKDLVTAFVKTEEWSKTHPEEDKQFYIDLAIQKKQDPTLIQLYKKPNDIRQYSLIQAEDLQYYADWLVKSGEFKPGTFNVSEYYTNKINPYYTSGP